MSKTEKTIWEIFNAKLVLIEISGLEDYKKLVTSYTTLYNLDSISFNDMCHAYFYIIGSNQSQEQIRINFLKKLKDVAYISDAAAQLFFRKKFLGCYFALCADKRDEKIAFMVPILACGNVLGSYHYDLSHEPRFVTVDEFCEILKEEEND